MGRGPTRLPGGVWPTMEPLLRTWPQLTIVSMEGVTWALPVRMRCGHPQQWSLVQVMSVLFMLDIGRIHVTSFHYTHTVKLVHSVLYLLPPTHNNLFPVLYAHANALTHSHIHTLLSISECVLEDLMPCNMSEIMTDKTKMEICCTFHGKARSICAKYTGVSIGSKATFTTSDHFCTETGSTKTCTEGLTWSGVTANLKEG